jgi:septal ring-binding cell division protein DamX
MSALLDFGTGAFSGAKTGYQLSNGNPYVTAGMGILEGGISLFGNSSARRMENEANRQSLAQGRQEMKLNDLSISQAMRQDKAERDAMAKRKMFGEMLGKWFSNRMQSQGGV